jgi:hypothetical protein
MSIIQTQSQMNLDINTSMTCVSELDITGFLSIKKLRTRVYLEFASKQKA